MGAAMNLTTANLLAHLFYVDMWTKVSPWVSAPFYHHLHI